MSENQEVQQQMSKEQLEVERKKFVAKIQAMDVEELIKFLQSQNRTDVYIIIRDMVTDVQKMNVRRNEEHKKAWKDLEKEAKAQWDYDHSQALMVDVNRAVTNAYTVLLRMISELNKDIERVKKVVNGIEDYMNLESTKWIEEQINQAQAKVDTIQEVVEEIAPTNDEQSEGVVNENVEGEQEDN